MRASQMSARETCRHETLRFASGDYYIICERCLGYWVCCDPTSIDAASPALSNQGVGSQLSGEVRRAEGKSE